MANLPRNPTSGKFEKKNAAGLSWFKNVAKSLGYTSTELISQLAPSMAEFTTTNVEYGKELAADIRELRSTGNRVKGAFNASSQVGHLKDALRNAMDDIKSGNIYNKGRQESIHDNDEFSFSSGDDDFGMIDFNFDEKDPSVEGKDVIVPDVKVNIKNITPPISKNNPMVKIMERQVQATYQTAEITNQNNIKIAQNSMMMGHKEHGRTLQGLQSINDNLALLVNFQGESMSKYVSSSLKYYEESLSVMTQTLEQLKLNVPKQEEQQYQRAADPTEDVLLNNGGLNVKGYMNMVKGNFRKQMSENPFLAPLKAMFDDDMTLKYLAASPLSFVSTKIVTSIVPKFLQDSLSNLDKSFSNFFPAMFMRLNKETLGSNNPIMQMLGEIFGLNVRSKSSVDLSKYNKGTVPFDGITRKAIVEVIPGYLRKILGALTGKEEQGYDFEDGRFKTVAQMDKDFSAKKDSLVTSSFSDSIEELKKMTETFPVESKKDRDVFMKGIEKFMIKLAQNDKLVNPTKTRDSDGASVDEIADTYDFEGNSDMQRVFRQMIMSMPKSSQTKMFGSNVIDARRQVRQMMMDAEDNPLKFNTNTLFNELGFDEHLNKGKKLPDGGFEVKKGSGILNPVDNLGFTSLDYLRDIKRILSDGIRVFISKGGKKGGQGGIGFNPHSDMHGDMDKQENDYRNKGLRENADMPTIFSDEDKRKFSVTGRQGISNFSDLGNTSDTDIKNRLRSRKDYIQSNVGAEPKKDNILNFVSRFLSGDTQENFNTIKDKLDNLLKKPAEIMKGIVDKIDNTLYKMVFGGTGEDGNTSFMSATMAKMRETFSKFMKWTDVKIITPLNESLFGKDGMITKLKDSDFMKNIKGKMKTIGDFIFGKATGANGKREGGMLSDTANSFADMWSGAKYYFTGKAYTNKAGVHFADNKTKSVFGEVQGMFNNFKDTMKTYLFGTKKDENGEKTDKGVLGGAFDTLKSGFHNFSEAIFGPKGVGANKDETVKQMMIKIKARAPKAIAGGIVGGGLGMVFGGGLLGAMVGGPMGAAIIGTAVSYLSQSDKFKDMVFGKKDEMGERVGGMINKSTQAFFKKNRVGIIGGAGVGALKSITGIGLLPSFLLPGGPIGGVMLGIGASILFKSEAFQKMMFGEKDADGKRMGGILQKAFGSNPKGKKIIGNIGAGILGGAGLGMVTSHLGLMGAMLIPGGPIGGAILGAAAGIALSSDRWKMALFGDFDEKTGKRKGGLLGKFQNWFKLEVMAPLQLEFKGISLSIKDWFTEKVGNPFREAIAPIKKEFSNMMTKMTDMFQNGWDAFKEKIGETFEKHVGQPFGLFMKEKVMDPLKKFFSSIIKGVGKVFGFILTSPIKALSAISQGLTEKHKKQGLDNFQDNERQDMFSKEGRNDRYERGEKLGLLSTKDSEGNKIGDGILQRMFKMHFSKETRDKARTSAAGADYLRDPAVTDEEKALQKAKSDQAWAELEQRKKELKMRQKLGMKLDYDNFDGKDNEISRYYDMHEKVTKMGQVDDEGRTMLSTIGVDVDQLIPGADMNNLSRKHKKQLSKIIKNKLQTGVLKNLPNPNNPTSEEIVSGEGSGAGEVVNQVEDSFNVVGDKITDTIKESSPKDIIKDELIPAVNETNKILKAVEKLLGHNKPKPTGTPKVKFTLGHKLPKLFGPIVPAPAPDDVDGSHADGIDEIPHDNYTANLHRGEAVVPSADASALRKGKASLLARIASDVRTIAQEVKGQLDGLGGNVFKIRKLVEQSTGSSDEDMSGSANRDRIGFFGKMRRMLFKPFEAMRDKLMQGLDWVTGKIKAVGEAVVKFGKFIIAIPKAIGKAIWDFTKGVGDVLKQGAITLLKIPVQLGKLVLGAMVTVVEAVKAVGPAIAKGLMGVATLFSGAAQMAAHAMIGFGKGIGSFFAEVGKGAGKVVVQMGIMAASLTKNIGKLLLGVTKTIADFTVGAISTAVDFTLGTVKMLSEKLLDVGNTLLQIVTSPLKFLATGIGKLFNSGPKEVIVKGGHLDSIGAIGSGPLDKKDNTPIRVTIAGVEESMPVYLSGERIKESFKRLFPIPVTIDEGNKASKVMNPAQATDIPFPDISSIGGSVANAITAIEDENNKERDAAKAKSERKDKMAKVNYKTADYQRSIIAAADEKQFTVDSTNKQTSLLEKIAGSTTEHKDSWMAVFGLKGILTAGFIMALPFLKRIWDFLKNFFKNGNDGEGNQSGDHAMDNAIKRAAVKALKHVPGKAVVATVKGAIKGTKKVIKAVSNSKTGKTIAKLMGRDVAEEGVEAGAEAAAKGAVGATDDVVEAGARAAAKEPGKIATVAIKAIDVVKENGERVMTSIKDFFERLMKNEKIAKALGSGAGKVITAIMADLGKFAKNPEFIAKMLNGIAKGTAKVAGSISTGGILDAGFAIWNLTTGFINKGDAAYLFNVYETEVTPKMRVIASLMKTILGVSFLFILELLNAIVVQLTNGKTNVLLMIANSMYQYMADDEAYENLSKAQMKFEADAEKNKMTKSAWNERNNKTFERKMVDGIKKGWDVTKDVGGRTLDALTPVGLIKAGKDMFNTDNVRKNLGLAEGEKVSVGQRLASGAGSMVNKISFGLLDTGKMAKGVANASQWVGDGAVKLGKGITNNAKWAGGKIADGAVAAGKGIANNAKWAGGKIADGAVAAGKGIAAGVNWTGDKIVQGAGAVVDAAKWAGGKVVDGAQAMTNGVKWAGNKIADGASAVWNSAPVETARNIVSGVYNSITTVSSAVGDALGAIAKAIWGRIEELGVWYVDKWKEAIKWAGEKWNSWVVEPLTEFGGFVKEKWNEATKWLGEKWNGWIVEPLTQFGELIKEKWNGAVKWLGEKWNSWVVEPLNLLGVTIKDKWNEATKWLGEKWNSWVIEPIDALGNFIVNKWAAAKDWFGEKWNSWVIEPIDALGNFIVDKWAAVKDWFGEKWSSWVSEPIAKMMGAIGTAWDTTTEWVGEKWGDWVVKPFGDLMGIVSDAWTTTAGFVSDKWKTYVVDPATALFTTIKKLWDDLTGWVTGIWDKVTGGAEVVVDTAKDLGNAAVNGVVNNANYVGDKVSEGWDSLWGSHGKAAKSGMQKGSDGVANDVRSIGDKIAAKIAGKGGPKYDYNGGNEAAGGTSMGQTPMEVSQKLFSGFTVTSGFGVRTDPINGGQSGHNGIDIAKADKSPISAFVGGEVIYAGMGQAGTGYGNMGNVVAIKDQAGYTHVYAHLNSVGVQKGQQIQPGQIIGAQGTTGRSTGSHLHYEVRQGGYGTSVDPTQYLLKSTSGGKLPTTTDLGSTGSADSTGSEPPKELSILDLMGKMSENFALYASNMYSGDNKEFKLFDDTETTNADGSSNGGLDSNFKPINVKDFPPALQQAIANKAAEMLIKGEGGSIDAITKDHPPGSNAPRGMSLGLMQWNKGRAKAMVQAMNQAAPGAGFGSFADDPSLWTDSWWPDSKIQQYKSMMNQNSSAANKVQRQILSNDIMNLNLSPIFQSGKLHDPRSVVMLSDIGNTGPAHIGKFLQEYNKPTDGSPEFPHFFKELKSKSYWANHMGTYGNRLNTTFNSLQSWNPPVGGTGGPFEPVNDSILSKAMGSKSPLEQAKITSSEERFNSAFNIPDQLADQFLEKAGITSTRVPSLVGSKYTDSYRSMQNSNITIDDGNNPEAMSRAIEVLEEIAVNTGATSRGISTLAAKEQKINIITTGSEKPEEAATVEQGKDGSQNVILVNNSSKSYNSNPMIGAMNDLKDVRAKADYSKAKSIASGGKF